jgi:cytochrome c biogenesis protein CcmG/thiol:disulfide interchange protein DsbE
MSRRVEPGPTHERQTRLSVWFFASVGLAALLILSGMLILSGVVVLGLMKQTSTSSQIAPDQFVTPPSQDNVAPDFDLTTLDGRAVKLSDYRGQVVLLNTWATWCPPCRAEMPQLEAYYREHQDQGFVVLAVNSEESPEAVAAFLKSQDFTFPVVLDPEGVVMGRYEVRALPTSFFIDRKGVVRGVWTGQLTPAQLQKIVDPLL